MCLDTLSLIACLHFFVSLPFIMRSLDRSRVVHPCDEVTIAQKKNNQGVGEPADAMFVQFNSNIFRVDRTGTRGIASCAVRTRQCIVC